MKFIVNTSFEPHFCTLIDENDQITDHHDITDFKKAGAEIWDFLAKNQIDSLTLSWVGGISGPGGFSSLRVSGAILNALSFRFKCPLRSLRADKAIQAFCDSQNITAPILLNSFGQGVFEVRGTKLHRIELPNLDLQKPYFTSVLPLRKKEILPLGLNPELTNIEKILFQLLSQQPDQTIFVPDYEYPAVKI